MPKPESAVPVVAPAPVVASEPVPVVAPAPVVVTRNVRRLEDEAPSFRRCRGCRHVVTELGAFPSHEGAADERRLEVEGPQVGDTYTWFCTSPCFTKNVKEVPGFESRPRRSQVPGYAPPVIPIT